MSRRKRLPRLCARIATPEEVTRVILDAGGIPVWAGGGGAEGAAWC